MEVKVKGKPKPSGKWYKEGIQIVPSEEFQIEEFDDGSSILTISETYPDDTGEIVFEAHNPLGVSTTTTYLSVQGNFKNAEIYDKYDFKKFKYKVIDINLFHFHFKNIFRF